MERLPDYNQFDHEPWGPAYPGFPFAGVASSSIIASGALAGVSRAMNMLPSANVISEVAHDLSMAGATLAALVAGCAAIAAIRDRDI